MKRTIRILAISLLLSIGLGLPFAQANSAIWWWEGVSNSGTVVTEDACPVSVEREVLTFDIPCVPKDRPKASQKDYAASVTAEYHLYNPTEQEVTMRLLFPFGELPDYYTDWNMGLAEEAASYGITAGDQELPYTLRHVLAEGGHPYVPYEDFGQIFDSYLDNGSFSPGMTVTCYGYEISFPDPEGTILPNGGYFGFELPERVENCWITFSKFGVEAACEDGTAAFATYVSPSDLYKDIELKVYALGDDLPQALKGRIYEQWDSEQNLFQNEVAADKAFRMTSRETMSLLDLTNRLLPEDREITSLDWYNAIVSRMVQEAEEKESGVVSLDWIPQPKLSQDDTGAQENRESSFYLDGVFPETELVDRLVQCYEYRLSIGPGERLIHRVTAPVFPGIKQEDGEYDFQYLYLLFPAKSWASFGELEVMVKTPFYLSSSSLDGFGKVEDGYRLVYSGLPEEELLFNLNLNARQEMDMPDLREKLPEEEEEKKEPAPNREKKDSDTFPWLPLIGVLVFVAAGGLCALLYARGRKRENP